MRHSWIASGVGLAVLCAALGVASATSQPPPSVPGVDTASIVANQSVTDNWPTYGLDYASTRYSVLDEINAQNVGKLGLAWTFDLGSTHHGVEATPLVIGGVMYVSAPWNIVYAIDAATGEKIWSYNPHVPKKTSIKGCCDVINRGVAAYQGKIFEATLDGRLIALDAATGKLVWSVHTVPKDSNYTISGAPLVAQGKVIIGNAGAEYAGVRGYVSAYDATTGKLDWRWYTVPGDSAHKPENAAMAAAVQTWDPKTRYRLKGGGGTVWNDFSYDPKLNLLYFGTGNPVPWNRAFRGGKAWKDLYTDSIVALNLTTGKYVWSYQTTPADASDYDADQDLVLADLELAGKRVPVIMQANKNGFFFILDRRDGHFISAHDFIPQNWARGYDKAGRPIETQVLGSRKPFASVPGPVGGHNWQSMSFSPQTGLVYIPAHHVPLTLEPLKAPGLNSLNAGGEMSGNGWDTGTFVSALPAGKPYAELLAWNPVTHARVWAHRHLAPWNGGTLATAGGLVFQGTATGHLVAYDARDGKTLWRADTGQGVIAPPISYRIGNRQYVSVAVGWGGSLGVAFQASGRQAPGRVFTYVLGGTAQPPATMKYPDGALLSGVKVVPGDAAAGHKVYIRHCQACHGVPGAGAGTGGSIPNLGHVDASVIANLDKFVFNGPFVGNGMPDFTGRLTAADVKELKAFIQASANKYRKPAAGQP